MNLGIESELKVYQIDFEGLPPGSYFLMGESAASYKKIFIGATGSYHFVTEQPFSYVAIPAKAGDRFIEYSGNFNFGYKGWVKSSFDLISKVQILDKVGHQFIGNSYIFRGEKNIMQYLTDIKHSVLAVKYLKFYPREIRPLYVDEANQIFYLTEEDSAHGGTPYTISEIFEHLDRMHLYKLYHVRGSKILDPNKTYEDLYLDIPHEDYYLDQSFRETPEYLMENRRYVYIDPYQYYWKKVHGRLENENDWDICRVTSFNDMELYNVLINDHTINMYDVFSRTYHGLEDIETLEIGPGVLLDMGYQLQESTYNFEEEDPIFKERYKDLYGSKGLRKKYIKEHQKLIAINDQVDSLLTEFNLLQENYLQELESKV
jgi:hypothetical protein